MTLGRGHSLWSEGQFYRVGDPPAGLLYREHTSPEVVYVYDPATKRLHANSAARRLLEDTAAPGSPATSTISAAAALELAAELAPHRGRVHLLDDQTPPLELRDIAAAPPAPRARAAAIATALEPGAEVLYRTYPPKAAKAARTALHDLTSGRIKALPPDQFTATLHRRPDGTHDLTISRTAMV